ncbi:MAG: cysteine desulfurase family protein, partial [Acidimicrobiales bacterium]
ASTAPIRPEALEAVQAAYLSPVADPARLHAEGLHARQSLELARDQIAAFLGARNREVMFTSGTSESAATVARAFAGEVQVVTAIEHPSVLKSVEAAGPALVVGVDTQGLVCLDELNSALGDDVAVVHVQFGNQETGVVQPVAEIAELCRSQGVLLHVDAAQAAGHLRIDFEALELDFLSLSAHKLGGPPGIGVLCIRRGVRIPALVVGGFQERARRAGFENLPAAAGFAAACTAIDISSEAATQESLVQELRTGLSQVSGVEIFTPQSSSLPHILCIGINDVEPQAVLLDLDRAGIAAHSGAACASEDLEPSPVLAAMGLDAHHSLRFSVGWHSEAQDIQRTLLEVAASLTRLRDLATR